MWDGCCDFGKLSDCDADVSIDWSLFDVGMAMLDVDRVHWLFVNS